MSANGDNEFFCDGITEEIINALSKIDQLRVISRTSSFFYKNHPAPLKDIGKELNVNIILEGSVRLAGTQLRISAQLVNVEEDAPFWSDIWNRKLENIFEIQDEISLLIADELREQFGHLDIDDHLVNTVTSDLNAYELILKGKYLFNKWNPEDVNSAITCFENALSRDTGLIDAYLGLADAYGFLATAGFAPREEGWGKVSEYIQKAKAIDPDNAELNYQLANHAFFTDADFAGAFRYTSRSILNRPNYVEGLQFMSFLYMLKGEMKKAEEYLGYATAIDPLNEETRFYQGYFYYRSHDYLRAIGIFEELLRRNPRNVPAKITHLYALLKSGEPEKVIEILAGDKGEIMPDEALGLYCLAMVFQNEANRTGEDFHKLETAAAENSSFQAHAYLFMAYAVLRENDQAFILLEKLFTLKSSILLLSFSGPIAENLRTDVRYTDYHHRIYQLSEQKPEMDSGKKRKAQSSLLDTETAKIYSKKLLTYLEAEAPYLNPALSLRLLASQIDMHPNQLSWLLNTHMGKNFNEFINQYRVAYFKKLAADQANAHISLIGLAFESGFNSKTVFNTVFKKETGMTPKEFMKNLE